KPIEGGYSVEALQGASMFGRERKVFKAAQVIFAGGVLGSVPLLLKLKQDAGGLPKLSDKLGAFVRTNSEALLGVVSRKGDRDFSQGIAIGSIVHTDEHSHLEPVRYPAGSGFFRLMAAPHVPGASAPVRVLRAAVEVLRHPLKFLRAYFVRDWAKSTMILLY